MPSPKVSNIVFRLNSIELKTQYASRTVSLQPMGELFVCLEGVPMLEDSSENLAIPEEGRIKVVGVDGLRFICKNLEMALYVDVDKGDF